MSELDPARIGLEAGWADLARDLVHMTLPNPGRRPTLDELLANYDLDSKALPELIANPRFKALLDTESARAKELGHRAGYVFRAETLLSLLAERMFLMAMSSEATPLDVVKSFSALLQSIGGVESGRAGQAGPVTNIQINVPALKNPKLRHIDGVQLSAD